MSTIKASQNYWTLNNILDFPNARIMVQMSRPWKIWVYKVYNYSFQNSDAVFDAFASAKLDDLKSAKKKVDQRRTTQEPDAFFAKYLTSEKVSFFVDKLCDSIHI